jgi:hypothetical protein
MNDQPAESGSAVARAVLKEIEATFDRAVHDTSKALEDRFGPDGEADAGEDDVVATAHDIAADTHAIRDINDITADSLRWPMDRVLRKARKALGP